MDSWAPSIIKTAQEMNNDDTKGRKKRWLDTGKPFCEQYAVCFILSFMYRESF